MLSHDRFDEMIHDWMSYAPLYMSIHVWQFRSICCIPYYAYSSHVNDYFFYLTPPKALLVQDMFNHTLGQIEGFMAGFVAK